MGIPSTFIGVYPHGLVLPPPTDPLYIAFLQALAAATCVTLSGIERSIQECSGGKQGSDSRADEDTTDDEAKGDSGGATAAGIALASGKPSQHSKPIILDDALKATCDTAVLLGHMVESYIKPWDNLGAAILRMFPSIPLLELHFDYDQPQAYFMRKTGPEDPPTFMATAPQEPLFFGTKEQLIADAAGSADRGAGLDTSTCAQSTDHEDDASDSDDSDYKVWLLDRKRYWDFVDNRRAEFHRVYHTVRVPSPQEVNRLIAVLLGYS